MDVGFHISVSADVLRLKFNSNWDHIRYNRYLGEALLYLADHHFKGRWAIIEDLKNWPVRLPEELKICSTVTSMLVEKGLTDVALCSNDLAVSEWMMKNMLAEKVNTKFFATDAACAGWLTKKGYHLSLIALDLDDIPVTQMALT